MRAHVVLSEELLKEVDRIAGKRKRSRFVEAAVREKLSREALSAALEESVGVLDLGEYPDWSTPKKSSDWVRAGRKEDEKRLARKLRHAAN